MCMFKVSKKNPTTLEQCVKYIQSSPERCVVLLLLTLNIFHSLFYCYYRWIPKNKCRFGLRNRSFKQFVSINCAQKMKFSIKHFFSNCDQIRSFLRIWSYLLKKSIMENLIFCAVCEKYCSMEWQNLLRHAFHHYSPNIRLRKDKFSWQRFKKIIQTLLILLDFNL